MRRNTVSLWRRRFLEFRHPLCDPQRPRAEIIEVFVSSASSQVVNAAGRAIGCSVRRPRETSGVGTTVCAPSEYSSSLVLIPSMPAASALRSTRLSASARFPRAKNRSHRLAPA